MIIFFFAIVKRRITGNDEMFEIKGRHPLYDGSTKDDPIPSKYPIKFANTIIWVWPHIDKLYKSKFAKNNFASSTAIWTTHIAANVE